MQRWGNEIEVETEIEGIRLRRWHHHLSARWAALFWEESLLRSQWHVLGTDSSGIQLQRSRFPLTLPPPSMGEVASAARRRGLSLKLLPPFSDNLPAPWAPTPPPAKGKRLTAFSVACGPSGCNTVTGIYQKDFSTHRSCSDSEG